MQAVIIPKSCPSDSRDLLQQEDLLRITSPRGIPLESTLPASPGCKAPSWRQNSEDQSQLLKFQEWQIDIARVVTGSLDNFYLFFSWGEMGKKYN